MSTDQHEVRGQSFLRYFGVVGLLFVAGMFCAALAVTQSISTLRWVSAGLIVAAGCVLPLLQWQLGFAIVVIDDETKQWFVDIVEIKKNLVDKYQALCLGNIYTEG